MYSWRMFPVGLLFGLLFATRTAHVLEGGVGDPQLMTDHPFWQGELSCSNFERLAKTQAELYARFTGRKTDNDEDKALASWFWRNTHYFHCTLLPEPDIFGQKENEVVRDYWAGLFSYGHSMCQETHFQYTAEMEYLLGHGRARAVAVEGHTSFEVWLTGGAYGKGKWVLLDSDITTVCFDKQQRTMMNIEELTHADRKAYLTNRAAKDNRGWLPELYPGDGVGTYVSIGWYALLCGYAGRPAAGRTAAGRNAPPLPAARAGRGSPGTAGLLGHLPGRHGWPEPAHHLPQLTRNTVSTPSRGRGGRRSGPPRPLRQCRLHLQARLQERRRKAGVAAEDEKSVTFEHCSPYIIAAKPTNKKCLQPGCTMGLVLQGKAHCKVCLSTDRMQTFSAPLDFTRRPGPDRPGQGALPVLAEVPGPGGKPGRRRTSPSPPAAWPAAT